MMSFRLWSMGSVEARAGTCHFPANCKGPPVVKPAGLPPPEAVGPLHFAPTHPREGLLLLPGRERDETDHRETVKPQEALTFVLLR